MGEEIRAGERPARPEGPERVGWFRRAARPGAADRLAGSGSASGLGTDTGTSSGTGTGPARSRLLWGGAIVLFWVLVLAGAVLASVGAWVRRTFGVISMDQLLSNLAGAGGEGAGGDRIVASGIVSGVLVPAMVVLAVALLCEFGRRDLRRRELLRGRGRTALRGIAAVLTVAVPVSGAMALGSTIGVREYVQAVVRETTTGLGLANYYVDPKPELGIRLGGGGGRTSAELGAGGDGAEPRNLVLIYLESVEDAFADDTRFARNMLAPVQESTAGWGSIPKLRQYEGGGWTMSGIVATQCGIPLRTADALSGNTELNRIGEQGKEVERYLPGATCLGDVLAGEGYRNVFMGGADARFAGKGAFLRTHGYEEVHDLSDWRELGETELREDWGLSDRRLMDRAKEEVTRLHQAGEPFNLTMLTLDTHEAPWLYDYCSYDPESEEALSGITDCSMREVAGFVDYLDDQGYLDDTTVVLMGDHLKMISEDASFWDELRDDEDRSIFNRVWSPDGVSFARDEIDQFSMYPTLLELSGVELRDHRAGIGVSALVPEREVPEGTILELSEQEYLDLVRSRSVDFYRELWSDAGAGSAAAASASTASGGTLDLPRR
ncbi:LTA synthase family protein [Leucobacter massiliensis]|uniref:Sulfatase N-terminal domain-containing protein n=1 Tax=Leucobacter massiliensis TaxID=1686285 RepID=A0A2S9QKT6_9MICO|nr:LTA synthase family protein [Leucobacter massiliensis]PRI10192.1 hypothetical protein B4915_12325 [Leucobacter massiliensis]